MIKENLLKLADKLDTVPQEYFDMYKYSRPKDDECKDFAVYDRRVTECGTIGCAAGYGPRAGIPVEPTDHEWMDYVNRVFAVDPDEWRYLFSSTWIDVDNTPKGAAARIRYVVKHGLPGNFWEQTIGAARLSYKVEK